MAGAEEPPQVCLACKHKEGDVDKDMGTLNSVMQQCHAVIPDLPTDLTASHVCEG